MSNEEKHLIRLIPEKEKLDFIREKENLGIVLQIAMTSRNLTAKIFAEKVRITPAAIHAIIQNNRKPSARLLRDMLNCLGLKPDQLIEIIDYYNHYEGKHRYTYTLYETIKMVVENMDNNVL